MQLNINKEISRRINQLGRDPHPSARDLINSYLDGLRDAGAVTNEELVAIGDRIALTLRAAAADSRNKLANPNMQTTMN